MGGEAGVSDDAYFIRGFARAGFEVHFLAPEGGEEPDSLFEGLHTHPYPNFFRRTMHRPNAVKRLSWQRMFNRTVLPRALALAQSLQPDFVLGHTHYSTKTTFLCREKLGIPSGVKFFGVMDLVHTEWPRWKYYLKNFEQIAALRYPQDVWIVLDDGTRGDDILASRGVPAGKIRFLPNGLNTEWADASYDRSAIREEYGFPGDAVVVLFLARLVASKRPEEVIRAISPAVEKARKARGEVLFVFAGDGPERPKCEALVRSLELEPMTRFVGTVRHADVPRFMAASDLFVTTSSLTNMAIPTCEAFVCGLPVVAYDSGETSKVVVNNQTGLLVDDGNHERLADAIVSLVDDAGARRRLGENARRFARENFTGWDERIQMELDIINEFIKKKAAG